MVSGIKTLSEKENSIQEFTVQFFADSVWVGSTILPLGQVSTDVLNLPDDLLMPELQKRIHTLFTAVEQELFNPNTKKDAALANALQRKLNDVLDIVCVLPLYRSLQIDWEFGRNLLPHTFQNETEMFARLCDPSSAEAAVFAGLLTALRAIIEDGLSFRTYISVLLDFYYEKLNRRNSEHYAVGLYDFLRNIPMQQQIAQSLPPYPGFQFLQSRRARIEYTTMPNPDNEKEYIIAERMVFDSIGAFLHVDFFRGLIHGNAPRRCHNCGRFFLLSDGYDTRSCNNIAPGETERTCRKVGAHRKEERKAESAIQAEYKKVYSRLKTRRRRGKISVDEWNRQVAVAQDYKEQAERGEISEFELKRVLEKM
jgi:hypothetical protein